MCECLALQWLSEVSHSRTFGLGSTGIDVHPLLTLMAAHQKAGDSLARQERVGLRYLHQQKQSMSVSCSFNNVSKHFTYGWLLTLEAESIGCCYENHLEILI